MIPDKSELFAEMWKRYAEECAKHSYADAYQDALKRYDRVYGKAGDEA